MCRDGFREWCGECGREIHCRDDFPICEDCLLYLARAAGVTQAAAHGWPTVAVEAAPEDVNW